MIHLTRAVARRWLEALLHIHDTPRRVAAAYALGVFFGFSPFLGLHHIAALGLAFTLGLSRVAVVAGLWTNLPWIVAPYYAFTTLVGAKLLGVATPLDLSEQLAAAFAHSPFDAGFWQVFTVLTPLVRPFFVGSAVSAALLAALGYQIALTFLIARRPTLRDRPHSLRSADGVRGIRDQARAEE
jgi:uncharacterized protein (DUF2062 family)